MISLIAAVAANGVIGSRNDLPWYLPSDLRRFKELTTGKTVVMGRRTYESILGRLGQPLPDRRNIVVTRKSGDFVGAEVIHTTRDIDRLGDVFVIGGAELYASTIDEADRLYLTEVHAEIVGDAYFPPIDRTQWQEVAREPHAADGVNQYPFDFVVYERVR
jgi:dihydrofolate reductase